MDPWHGLPVEAGISIWTAQPRPLVAGGKNPLRAGAISTEKRKAIESSEYLDDHLAWLGVTIGLRSESITDE